MIQFPVSSQQGVIDSLNYVLSGPQSSGQNFAGYSFSGDGLQYDLTGSYRAPFTQPNYNSPGVPNIPLYIAPVSISTIEFLDSRTLKATFTTPYAPGGSPFKQGMAYGLTGTGFSNPAYDDLVTNDAFRIGIVNSTDTYITMRLTDAVTPLASATGGTIGVNSMKLKLSTDCNAKVTVTGGQDRVVIAAQLNNQIFVDPAFPGSFYYEVYINRYKAESNNDPTNPDYIFNPDATIAFKSKLLSTLTLEPQETIFTSIIDQPVPGYYWYILEVVYRDNAGGVIVTNSILTQRSFSAQVLKP